MTALPDEVFPNPTVQQVVFQIRFPSLFFIESRLGDFQLQIMPKFPESELRIQRSVMFAHGTDPEAVIKQSPEMEAPTKLWTFKNQSGVLVELKHDSLTILSTQHKSYRTGTDTFREVIEFVLTSLLKVIPVPIVTRLGLRYVDSCPVPEFTTEGISKYYATTLPVNRFSLETMQSEMTLRAVSTRGADRRIQYIEQLHPPTAENGNKATLVLDFDASADNLRPTDVLAVSDELHKMIRSEFESTIKQPVIDWMRGKQ